MRMNGPQEPAGGMRSSWLMHGFSDSVSCTPSSHCGIVEASAGSGMMDLPTHDGLPEYSESDPAWAAFDTGLSAKAQPFFDSPLYQMAASTSSGRTIAGSASGRHEAYRMTTSSVSSRTAVESASGTHAEFQMATSSGSGSSSEARSASDSCGSATSNTESDDSVDSGDELWKAAKVSDAEAQAVFGSSSDAISQAYKVARSQAFKPPRSRRPTIPEPAVPFTKSLQARKLKRAAKAEAAQTRKGFLASHARKQALGNYKLPAHKPAILLSLQAPHCIVDVNAEWCRWCCFSRDEVLGQPYTITHGAGTERQRVARIKAAMQAGVGCIGVLT